MPRYLLHVAVFLAGLLAVCGIAVGYIGSNALAFAVTIVIGACYLAGAWELQRYQQTTRALADAIDRSATAPKSLGVWLDQVPAVLRHAVRLRIEGERVALPGPALAPYLAGLLVLLGMLGTLLGMVATLRGTGAALESSTDLAAIRASLAAPVTGLGFAFGTSIAGVATSAMLGLLSTLCRRERLHAARQLDAKIATTLRAFTQTHQREETFRLLQRQTEVMPKLVDRLHAMMAAIEQQSLAANERQLANQTAFHTNTETAYRRLATSVELSLKQSVADSARAASAALQPVMQATMDGIARETAALHANIEGAVKRQLEGLSSGFETSAANVADIWNRSLEAHQAANESLVGKMDASMERFAQAFEARSSSLVDGMSARFEDVSHELRASVAKHEEASTALVTQAGASLDGFVQAFGQRSSRLVDSVSSRIDHVSDELRASVAKHEEASAALVTRTGASLDGFVQAFGQRSATLVDDVSARLTDVSSTLSEAIERHGQASATLITQAGASLDRFAASVEARSTHLLEGFSSRLESTSAAMSEAWRSALTEQQRTGERLSEQHRDALDAAADRFEQHAASLLRSVDDAHASLRTEIASTNDARLSAWTDALAAIAAALRDEWRQSGALAERREQQVVETLARTAREIAEETRSHTNGMIGEIERVVQAASEAPKAAAEVIAEMREKLSDSMVRDTAMLNERSRLLGTVETLLDAVNHASNEQRVAVDALVATSADMLTRTGKQFSDKVEAESEKIGAIAARVSGSAVEVASLGEAFGAAVDAFGASNQTLVAHLQRIETALDKSLARSDEQLAYYVAQAREVIDLSMLSQKQIIENLQQIAAQRELAGARE
ncbi:DUF802 domain-containing protein [Caballeronia sp. LZ016]|uniref:DUF802 domain-containing protein n=1 Tax=Caballeronia sp. LZ016 TaxID=3038554 RepID=UPI002857D2A0|nr:DUF802 domain-containing protein [Caballeronia sp. LZ016]MDR5740403.1 DUF802 domain-containing protein [Caballeronia sp. LZ016]